MQLLIRVRVGTRAVTDLRASLPISRGDALLGVCSRGQHPNQQNDGPQNQAPPRATRRVLRGG